MIELTCDDIKLLRHIPSLPLPLTHRLETAQGHPVSLSDEEREVLLTAVADHLTTHGFDASYRPTALGAALERLIDRITRSVQD